MFKMQEIFKAELTVSFAPNKVIIIETKIIGTPNLIGFPYDNLESLSFSNSILPTSFEEEFFILFNKIRIFYKHI